MPSGARAAEGAGGNRKVCGFARIYPWILRPILFRIFRRCGDIRSGKRLQRPEHDIAVDVLNRERRIGEQRFGDFMVARKIRAYEARQIVGGAADHVALGHFGHGFQLGFKFGLTLLALLAQRDRREDRHALPKLGGIDDRAIAADDTGVLQLLHAGKAGALRQVHLFGELRVADTGIPLKHAENLEIDLVQLHDRGIVTRRDASAQSFSVPSFRRWDSQRTPTRV